MVHASIASMLLCVVTADGPALQAVVTSARQDYHAERLIETVNFDGFDDPKFTFQDTLEYLTDRYDLTFDVDEAAFARANLKEILSFKIAEEKPLTRARGVSLDTVVRKILS